jgi:gas vesicle protein
MFTMYNYKKEQEKKVITASIIGGVVGAFIALFISPIKGSQARKLVADKAKNTALNIENKFHEGINHIEEAAENVKSDVDTNIQNARKKTENSINSARSRVAEKIEPDSK